MEGYQEKLEHWAEKQMEAIEKSPGERRIREYMMMGAFLFAYNAGFISLEIENELYKRFCR